MAIRKILILLFFISVASCSKSQYHFYHMIRTGAVAKTLSTVKNIQALVDSPAYEAFGVPVQNEATQATYYYRRGITHTASGNPYYRTFNMLTGIMSSPVLIASDSIDCRDISGGHMDNDSNVIFYARHHTDAFGSYDLYIQKCDNKNNFSARVLFNWTGITHLEAGFFWGPMVTGNSPGEYFEMLYQTNVDTGTVPRYRVSIIKTTDYWNHYTEAGVLYDGTSQYSETACANLGSGKFLAIARLNNSGGLTPFESTDNGANWTRRNVCNLPWYGGGGPSIPYIYTHDGVFDIPFQCRDTRMVLTSIGNTITGTSFGVSSPVYNNPEIYAYHLGTGGNPSLGYVSELKLSNGKFLMIFSKQYNNNRANLQVTYDDQVSDEAGIPPAPTLATSSIATTSFRVDVTGYTDKQWENIRYLSEDLSTDPAFGSFVTCQYLNPSDGHPNTLMHDVRMTGYFDSYNLLTTGTTYYLRIKACNNTGCSAFTTVNITTL